MDCDWIDVKDRLPETRGPWEVLCPAGTWVREEVRVVYFNTEDGRSHRCLERKGMFKCVRLITHWRQRT